MQRLAAATIGAMATVVAGCSFDALELVGAVPSLANACRTDADCGADAQCGPGICVASRGDLASVVLEISPPASAFYGAGDSFIVPVDGVATADFSRALVLPEYVEVASRITADINDPGACPASYVEFDKSLAVHVELTRSDAVWGLPATTYAANATMTDGGWAFSLRVPSGTYDMYVASLAECAAEFPPVLIRRQALAAGNVPSAYNVGTPMLIEGTVKPPIDEATQKPSLDGWSVSLVEPRQGRAISTTHTWMSGDASSFSLRYRPIEAPESPLLVITPPKGLAAPSVVWDLSVVDLDGNGSVDLDMSSVGVQSKVTVRARLIDEAASQANVAGVAGATAKLRSTSLDNISDHGLSAVYETSANADDSGDVTLEVLPGRYRVVVVPPDQSSLAVAESEWVIAPSPLEQAGRTFAVPARTRLSGVIEGPRGGEPFGSISVAVAPSVFAPSSFLERTIAPDPVSPRVTSGFTGSDGRFDIPVDPGSLDFAAQPSADSHFPWLVRSRVKLPSDTLGRMTIGYPVPIRGTLHDPQGNAVQQALLRVYAPLDATGAADVTRPLNDPRIEGVLLVAEARTDELGRFQLLLPAAIH